MRYFIAFLLVLVLMPQVSFAQDGDDDGGFLTRTIEGALSGVGREVNIQGFQGALSSEASFERMTIADDQGIWLTLEQVKLIWSRAALLRGRLEVTELRAARLDLPRLPQAPEEDFEVPQAEAQGFELPQLPELPVSVLIETMGIDELILGEPIIGVAARMSLTASARLDDDGLDARLDATRIDGQEGTFGLGAKFARESEVLDVDLVLDEAPGGLVARLISLPDQPSVSLEIKGAGPLHDFGADIDFSTDDVQRVVGRVKSAGALPGEEGDTNLTVDISGDIAPLVAPEYTEFFGNDIGLQADATLLQDGMIALNTFDLRARVLELSGNAMLNKDRWPVLIDVGGSLASPDRAPIALPGANGATVDTATLTVTYDAAQGEAFAADVVVGDIITDQLRIEETRLNADGTLQGNLNSVGQFLADLTVTARGLDLEAAEVSQAMGRDLTLSTSINFIEGQPVRLSDLSVKGAGIDVDGWAIVATPTGDVPTRFDLAVAVAELERFSGLAQRDLGGAATVQAEGSVFPLDGKFDVALDGTTQDLAIGIEQADAVLGGLTRLNLRARRDETGTFVDDLALENDQVSVKADADIRSGKSRVNATARLVDLGLIVPQYPGAVSADVEASDDGGGWTVDADIAGPDGATVSLAGLATGPDAALDFNARLPDIAVFVPEVPGPLSVEGRAERAPEGWKLQTNATGPSGTTAVIAGLARDDGTLDMLANGTVPLDLAQPFITPRTVAGRARFDLRIDGPPELSSIAGEITTDGVSASAPNARMALEDVTTLVRLNGGRATVSVGANVSNGGRIETDGNITLDGTPSANLNLRLNNVVIADPRLFETQISGTIDINGPLAPGPRIAGVINIGETEVTVPASGITSIGDIPTITHVGSSRAETETRRRAGLIVDPEEATQAVSGPGLPLDIQINAPNRIFIRGRGLNAELGGSLTLTGTTSRIISAGSFDLIRGWLDILGKRFDLVEGSAQFQGNLVPYIRFVTETSTEAGTASIIVQGPADEPEVLFESDPEAPQDEVLAQILFGTDISNISALQALELANAVATLAGRGGDGVIGRLRNGFGLDNLDLTTTDDGQTAVRVGKYLTDNVYTDFTAAADGTSEVNLNLDVTDSLKATVGAKSDGDSSLGLFFERDY